MKKRILSALVASVMAVTLLAGCGAKDSSSGSSSSDKKKIGVCISSFDDKWLSYMLDAMKAYSGTLTDIEVTYVDSKNDANKQLSQVENFIAQSYDAIVVNPVDTDTSKPLTDKAKAANVPIISVNRPFANQTDAAAYVGSNSIEAGTIQMEYLAKAVNGKGNVAIMMGVMGQEAQRMRTEGVKQVVAKYPDMKIILESTAEWDRAKGMTLMENWIASGQDIAVVASNNDEMAIGAIKAIEAAGKLGKIKVGGVDATVDALEYVKAGKLDVTVFQDAKGQGKGAVEAAVKVVKGESVEKEIWIPFEQVIQKDADTYMAKWAK